MALHKGPTASVMLSLCKTVDKRIWSFQHPLLQYTDLPADILTKIDKLPSTMSIVALRDMEPKEIGEAIRHVRMGDKLSRCVIEFPLLSLEAEVQPITRTVLRVTLYVTPGTHT
jgi:Sec63 Brl domain